ncbi:MAG: hypothetical protein ACFE9A_16885 [Candidatus Hodarchaeota archaeon]
MSGVVILLLLFPPLIVNAGSPLQGGKLIAKVGDTKKYALTQFFDRTDYDGDGDNSTFLFSEDWGKSIRDEDGNLIEVKFQKGSTIKFKITGSIDNISIQRTFDEGTETPSDGRLLGLPFLFARIVSPGFREICRMALRVVVSTVDNKSYWEEIAEEEECYTVEGDLFRLSATSNWDDELITTLEYDYYRNWRTGWLTSFYARSLNESITIFEYEYSMVEDDPDFVSFSIIPVIIGLVLIVFPVVRRKTRFFREKKC